jgi:hypothetical protein
MKLYHCIADKSSITTDVYGQGFSLIAYENTTGLGCHLVARNCICYWPDSIGGTGEPYRNTWFIWERFNNTGNDNSWDIDYGVYDPTGCTKFARIIADGVDNKYTFSEFQAAAGNTDDNSKTSTDIDTYWTDVGNNDYTIKSGSSPLIGEGTLISDPSSALTDKNSVTREDPPEVGPYEFGVVEAVMEGVSLQ